METERIIEYSEFLEHQKDGDLWVILGDDASGDFSILDLWIFCILNFFFF